MRRIAPILLIMLTICLCGCSKTLSFDSTYGKDAKEITDAFEFPPEEEIDKFLEPYMEVLTEIKENYGVDISFTTLAQKQKLYLKCLNIDTEEFKENVLTAIGEGEEAIKNLPYTTNFLEDIGATFTREFTDFLTDEFSFLNK
ncbi:MAG: hypothetical protein J5626_06355 [Lachnospiraceae bacterium]|nr:hypothetical protein [Lachnospiraceae bacterium]